MTSPTSRAECWDSGKALGRGRDRDAGAGVRVQHALGLGARFVHAAVDDEAGLVDAEAGDILDDVALMVDLDQVRRSHLVEHQAVGVQQELVLGIRDARRSG